MPDLAMTCFTCKMSLCFVMCLPVVSMNNRPEVLGCLTRYWSMAAIGHSVRLSFPKMIVTP